MPDDVPTFANCPLTIKVQSLEQIFGSQPAFHLPWFQRAYAWCEEHAARLFGDIVRAIETERSHYFLGHVLLAGPPEAASVALIDGHQRTLTLTILFALLRDRAPTAEGRQRLHKAISAEPGKRLTPHHPASQSAGPYHVATQPSVSAFFARYVQDPGATALDTEDYDDELTEVELRIIENRRRLASLLDAYLDDEDNAAQRWQELAEFLLARCFIVVERVADEFEGWDMLATEEATGLPFHSAERLKISLISAMPRNEQDDASRRWEAWQAQLGRDNLHRLVHHVRALELGHRSNQPIEQELIRRMKLNQGGAVFFDKLLAPNVTHFARLLASDFGDDEAGRTISRAIRYMQWLERDVWVLPALRWLELFGAKATDSAVFFQRLERLAWFQRIATNDPVQQERRFIRLANEIAMGRTIDQLEGLAIEPKLRDDMRKNLLSRTFYDKRYSRIVLRRICAELGEDPGEVDGNTVTVEHILPRRPPRGSVWLDEFNKGAIGNCVNRLGNLTLLSFEDNQRLATHPFEEKAPVLANSKFAISRDAASVETWTAREIEMRSLRLARFLFERWELPFPR